MICGFAGKKSQDLKAFQFHNQNGDKVNTEKFVKKIAKYDVVLFGEYHNNSIIHWLQLKITEEFYKQNEGKFILGEKCLRLIIKHN